MPYTKLIKYKGYLVTIIIYIADRLVDRERKVINQILKDKAKALMAA